MVNDRFIYISLEVLAAKVGLPKAYLKELTAKGLIPSLNVSGRLRFNPDAVKAALNELAAKRGAGDE